MLQQEHLPGLAPFTTCYNGVIFLHFCFQETRTKLRMEWCVKKCRGLDHLFMSYFAKVEYKENNARRPRLLFPLVYRYSSFKPSPFHVVRLLYVYKIASTEASAWSSILVLLSYARDGRHSCTGAKVVILPQILVILHDAADEAGHAARHALDDALCDILVKGTAHAPPHHGPAALVPLVALERRGAQAAAVAQLAGGVLDGEANEPGRPGALVLAAHQGDGVGEGREDVQDLGGLADAAELVEELGRGADVVGGEDAAEEVGADVAGLGEGGHAHAGAGHGPVARVGGRRHHLLGLFGGHAVGVAVDNVGAVFERKLALATQQRQIVGVVFILQLVWDRLALRQDRADNLAGAGDAQQQQAADGLDALEEDNDAPSQLLAAAALG